MTVLIVEDSKVTRELLYRLCFELGHEALLAGDGCEALHQMTPEVKCVLMDLHLPGEDGWDVTRRILGHYPETYVIAVTSNVSAEHQGLCYQVGMAEFLIKPVCAETLREALERAENS